MEPNTDRHLETNYPGSSVQNDAALNSSQSLIPPAASKPSLHEYLLDRLFELHEKQEFCDLVFDLKGVKFFCHRIVVAAWSPFLHNQLYGQDAKKEFLKLQFDHLDVFSSFIGYLYSGYIDLQETDLTQVLRLASSFQVEPLRVSCEAVLRCSLHVGNIVTTYSVACKFKLTSLQEEAIALLQMHLPDAVKEPGFLSQTAVGFNTFLSSEAVRKLKPEIKLFLIISWLCYDVGQREQYFVALLQHINWSAVANDFLVEISQTENFFTTNESSLYLLLQTLHTSSISLGPYTEAFPGLRKKYFDLLGEVVKNSSLEVIPEEYFPVPVTQISNPQEKPCQSKVHGNKSSTKGVQTTFLSSLTEIQSNLWNTKIDFNQPSPSGKEKDGAKSNPAHVTRSVKRKGRKCRLRKIVETSLKTHSEVDDVSPLKLQRTKMKMKPNEEKISQTPCERRAEKIQEKINISSNELAGTLEEHGINSPETSPEPLDEELKHDDAPDDDDYINTESYSNDCDDLGDQDGDESPSDNKEHQFRKKTKPSVRNLVASSIQTSGVDGGTRQRLKSRLSRWRQLGRPKKYGRPAKQRVCKECDYVAASDERMASHIEKVHNVGTTYRCAVCKYECKWNKNYYNHVRQHFPGPPYECDQEGCAFQAERIQLLIQHRARHFGDRQFACKDCGMRFLSRNNLHAHKKTHTGLKPFECGVCGRSFATKNTLSQHMVVHSDDRPYLCDTCGFSSKYQSHLIAHRRIHTGQVFHCQFPQCAYFTPKRSQLKGHMRAHLGIRHHVCSQCGKAFVEKSHLTRHERLHNSERPFKCTQCDYHSTRRDKLREHQNKHHLAEPAAKSHKPNRRARKNNRLLSSPPPLPPPAPPSQPPPTAEGSDLMKIAQIVAGEHGYHRKLPIPSSDSSSPCYLSQFNQMLQDSQLPEQSPQQMIMMKATQTASPQDQLVHTANMDSVAVTQALIMSHINNSSSSSSSHSHMGQEVPQQYVQQQQQQQGANINLPVAMADVTGLVAMTTPATSGVIAASNGQQIQQEYDSLGNFMTFL